jgi:hypothetical protein
MKINSWENIPDGWGSYYVKSKNVSTLIRGNRVCCIARGRKTSKVVDTVVAKSGDL